MEGNRHKVFTAAEIAENTEQFRYFCSPHLTLCSDLPVLSDYLTPSNQISSDRYINYITRPLTPLHG